MILWWLAVWCSAFRSEHYLYINISKANYRKLGIQGNANSITGATRLRTRPHPPSGKESYVSVTPFDTGRMITPSCSIVEDAQGTSMVTSWRFFIRHEKSTTCLWFDMERGHASFLIFVSIAAICNVISRI